MENTLSCPRCDTAVSVARAEGLRGICPRCLFEELTRPDEAGAARSPLELLEGQELGNYVVLGLVGSGGMGVVYRARQKGLERTVALKILNTRGPGEVERFFVEARSAAKLQHAHIVPIHEVVTDRGYYFFTMDYVEGRTLADEIRRGDVFPRRAAEWVSQVARAVHYAHENGIIHRDLKPANILVDRHGAAKVMDFGLAKDVSTDAGLTTTGTTMGTPAYMPPEQAMGGAVDARSDVYALGAVMYESLTGAAPFSGRNVGETLQKVIHQEPAPPAGLPADIVTVCLKAMQKEPSQRYASAAALADDLDRFVRGEPVLGRRPSVAYRARRFLSRHAFAAALLAVIAGLSVWSLTRPGPDPTIRERSAALVAEAGKDIQTAEQLREADERARRDEFLRRAEERLAEAEAMDPGYAEIPYWRGTARTMSYRLEEAVDAFSAAILLDPGHQPARAARAVANGRLLLQSLWGTLREPEPYRLAMLRDDIRLLDGDRLDVAQAYLAAVEATAPVLAATWSRSPVPAEAAAVRDRLRAHAAAAVEARPTNADAQFLAGQADYLADIRDPARVAVAHAAVERALRYAPNDMWFRTLETYYLAQIGRAADAVSRGRELVRVAPDLDQSHVFLAAALEVSDDLPGAEAALADAMKVTRQPAYVHLWHAMILMRLLSRHDDPANWLRNVADRPTRERVLSILDAALAEDPTHASARIFRGAIHFTAGDEARAREDFSRFAAAAPALVRHMSTIRRYIDLDLGDFDAYRRVLRVERSSGDDREYAFRLSLAATYFSDPAQLRELLQELALAQLRLGDRAALMSTLTRLAENDWHGWHRIERAPGFAPDAAYRELKARFSGDPQARLDEARACLARSRELAERARYLTEPADRARRAGWLEEAMAELDRAEELAPDVLDIHMLTGRVHSDRGDYRRAAESFGEAIRQEPGNIEARRERLLAARFQSLGSWGAFGRGDSIERAVMEEDIAVLEASPGNERWIHIARGLAAVDDYMFEMTEKRSPNAETIDLIRLHAEATLAADEADPLGHLLTAMWRLALSPGAPEQLVHATTALDRALELDPNRLKTRLLLVRALAESNRMDEAIQHLEHARQIGPTDAGVLQAHGMILKLEGRPEEALAVLDHALEVCDNPVAIRISRAGLLCTGFSESIDTIPPARYEEAMRDLNAALAMKADDPEALYWRGSLQVLTGRAVRAGRADLERFCELHPDSPMIGEARRMLGR